MDFTESIKQFSERVSMLKDTVSTEEATKMSLVVPLFQLLGYDVFNPSEFCPEYIADVGIKKGEKVDYAILENGQPIILVECKSCSEQLDKHSSQLFRYFGTSPAKFGILTNGVIYRFYTDLEESNKMDLVPFLELNMLQLKDTSINELKKFCKDNFDKDKIFNASTCGDNCAKWLLKIAESEDRTINLLHLMDFGPESFSIHILNTDQIVHSMEELVSIAGEFV